MDIKQIAATLLVGRLVSVIFIFFVIRKQYQLMKLPIAPELVAFRKVLFAIALVIFVGSLVAISVDILTLLSSNSLERAKTVSGTNMLYVFTNELVAIMSAVFIWLLYRLAGRTAVTTKKDIVDAIAVSDKRLKDKKI